MKIYTKTGDDGDTSLFGGGRVRKSSLRVEAYGTVDELNALLGTVRAQTLPEQVERWLMTVQHTLFNLGADLATPLQSSVKHVVRIEEAAVTALEAAIDQMEADLPPLKQFILPGGVPAAAALHVARTVSRRAERVTVALNDNDAINPVALIYLNRLSDFLFVLARWVNFQAGVNETRWQIRS